MVVAVQQGLNHIKAQLRQMGYETVTYGDYPYPVDALVYYGSLSRRSVLQATVPQQKKGMLLVCADNKTVAEIAEVLNRRLYTPLF